MTQEKRPDPLPHLRAVAAALAEGGQPGATFAALDRAMAGAFGHKLFTILVYHPNTRESERFYSSMPREYPVGGRKPFNQTFWAQQVLVERRPFIGRSAADIKSVFYDNELIHALGCDAVINLPVVHDKGVLGTINVLNAAGWFAESDVPLGLTFAALA
ncbi:MAG: GAF domain-containing protein, partial [Alphaproteobacteria bacterium]|nr:GAF domain-containing protein [Alphaproteobacteria bacterium]